MFRVLLFWIIWTLYSIPQRWRLIQNTDSLYWSTLNHALCYIRCLSIKYGQCLGSMLTWVDAKYDVTRSPFTACGFVKSGQVRLPVGSNVVDQWGGWEWPERQRLGLPSANLTPAKALVPRVFGTRCLARKQNKTESLTKTNYEPDKAFDPQLKLGGGVSINWRTISFSERAWKLGSSNFFFRCRRRRRFIFLLLRWMKFFFSFFFFF